MAWVERTGQRSWWVRYRTNSFRPPSIHDKVSRLRRTARAELDHAIDVIAPVRLLSPEKRRE